MLNSFKYFIQGLKETFLFSGRATRTEFWWFNFWAFIAVSFFLLIDYSAYLYFGYNPLKIIEGLPPTISWVTIVGNVLLFPPSLTIAVRRLHDINKSAFWLIPALILTFLLLSFPVLLIPFGVLLSLLGNNSVIFASVGIFSFILFLVNAAYFYIIYLFTLPSYSGKNFLGVEEKK